jgi:hypothetical protein
MVMNGDIIKSEWVFLLKFSTEMLIRTINVTLTHN